MTLDEKEKTTGGWYKRPFSTCHGGRAGTKKLTCCGGSGMNTSLESRGTENKTKEGNKILNRNAARNGLS